MKFLRVQVTCVRDLCQLLVCVLMVSFTALFCFLWFCKLGASSKGLICFGLNSCGFLSPSHSPAGSSAGIQVLQACSGLHRRSLPSYLQALQLLGTNFLLNEGWGLCLEPETWHVVDKLLLIVTISNHQLTIDNSDSNNGHHSLSSLLCQLGIWHAIWRFRLAFMTFCGI